MAKAESATVHKTMEEHSKLFRDLLLGFVKIHVLYHASQDAVYGMGITAELEKHGYRLSPGTLYPLLHNLEASNMLVREERIVGGKVRKYYYITPLGQQVLDEARRKLADLTEEVLGSDNGRKSGSKAVAGRKRRT
jgi:DNA-binding PadR family transcriptional regulator